MVKVLSLGGHDTRMFLDILHEINKSQRRRVLEKFKE